MLDLNTTLAEALGRSDFIDSMRLGIESFGRYRDALPLQPLAYTRTQLRRTDEFELVAMLWAPGSRSVIHNHGNSRCWVLILEGALDTENFERTDDREERATLRSDGHARMTRGDFDHRYNAREMHRVANLEDAPAYSLQLYSEPLSVFTTVIDEHTGRTGTMNSTIDSVFAL